MLREKYLTAESMGRKTSEWLVELEAYSRRRSGGGEGIGGDCNISSRCALLVIDMQNFFLDERSHACVPSAGAIVPNIMEMI